MVLDEGSSADKALQLELAWYNHERNVEWQREPFAVIVNYETARLLDLDAFDWDFVVADESHKLKSHDSKQSKELAWKLRNVKHKLAMTGTPWSDRPIDVFGQVRFLEPFKKGRAFGAERFGAWTVNR